MANPGMTFKVDMSEINELLGTFFALEKIGPQTNYMKLLVQEAVKDAESQFNREVVAFAMSTGTLSHMFEWGTLGINRGRSNMRPNAMSDRARLWETKFNNSRTGVNVSYSFRSSKAYVPKPTVRDTDIPNKIIKKLKNHVFWDKARILEMGIPVVVKPKSDNALGGKLFVPNLWKKKRGVPGSYKGFSLYRRPTEPNVSENTKGTFTIYWVNFWEGRGFEQVSREVTDNFEKDLMKEVLRIRSRANRRMKLAGTTNDEAQIKMAQKTLLKNLERRARQRIDGN